MRRISFGGEHELQGSSPRNSFEQIDSDKYDNGYIEMRRAGGHRKG